MALCTIERLTYTNRFNPAILSRNLFSATIVPPGPFDQTDNAADWLFCHMASPSLRHNGLVHHLRHHSCWQPLVLLQLHLLLWTRPCDTWSVWVVSETRSEFHAAFQVRIIGSDWSWSQLLRTQPRTFPAYAEGRPPWRPTKSHHQQKESWDVILRLQSPTHCWPWLSLKNLSTKNQGEDQPTPRTTENVLKTQLSLPSHAVVSLKNLQTSLCHVHKAQVERTQ